MSSAYTVLCLLFTLMTSSTCSSSSRHYQALISSHVAHTLNAGRRSTCTPHVTSSAESANEREGLWRALHDDVSRIRRHTHARHPLGMCVHLTGDKSPLSLKHSHVLHLPRSNFSVSLWVKAEGGQRENAIIIGMMFTNELLDLCILLLYLYTNVSHCCTCTLM